MINQLKKICFEAIIEKNSDLHKHINLNYINISRSKNDKFGHFQLNDTLVLSKYVNLDVFEIYRLLKNFLELSIYNNKITISFIKPCFINFTFTKDLIENEIKKILYFKKNDLYDEFLEKILLDYSSPNIAKEMHVGHLRSTIVGDCLSNLFKILGHKIIKVSHLGDWGTQFGMLINYIKLKHSPADFLKIKITLKKLSDYYKNAQTKFTADENFAKNSKNEVVNLQAESNDSMRIWKKITKLSKREYEKIYKLLDVKIEYKGESFYNKLLNPFIRLLEKKNKIVSSDGAKCVHIDNFIHKNNTSDLIIVKKTDGAFNYATTDLAALYYRITYHNPDKIIYITDGGQKDHFYAVFKIIKNISLKFSNVVLIHIPLGLMLDSDGKKIKTRSGKSEKLIDLIFKSIKFSKNILNIKNIKLSKENIMSKSFKLGINAIKYADLSHNLEQNYIFNYSKMLQSKGNTAAFITYAYVRIVGIKNKTGNINIKKIMHDKSVNLIDKVEIELSLHLLQYIYIIKRVSYTLNPNILTLYLYLLAEKFHTFFHACNVSQYEFIYSRLTLCEVTKMVLELGFKILGLKKINEM